MRALSSQTETLLALIKNYIVYSEIRKSFKFCDFFPKQFYMQKVRPRGPDSPRSCDYPEDSEKILNRLK